MHAICRLLVLALAASAGAAQAQSDCRDTPEGRICSHRQPLISGELVGTALQQQLGLVTVSSPAGSCSGTLLNRNWVLTAAHCITTNGRDSGPQAAAGSIRVSATWTTATASPTLIVNYFTSHRLDVALLGLALTDLGPANIQLLRVQALETGDLITKYGRGISSYARAGTPPVPAGMDGRYRTARFDVSDGGERGYSYALNDLGQIAAGGDSGGPDHLTGHGGVSLGIAGVSARCHATFLPGANDWRWVTAISSCSSAAIHTIRDDIVQRIQRRPNLEAQMTTPAPRIPRRPSADALVTRPSGIARIRP